MTDNRYEQPTLKDQEDSRPWKISIPFQQLADFV